MKVKKILSILTICALFFCCTFTVANAESDDSNTYTYGETTFVFENGISEYTKNKIIADFTDAAEPSAEARGLTCTLFGHDLETGTTTTVTHKARATAPRCLKEKFSYEICSRCDYSNYTRLSYEYISCCS